MHVLGILYPLVVALFIQCFFGHFVHFITNIPEIINTAEPQVNIFTITMFVYFRRGVTRGTLKGLSIQTCVAINSMIAYLLLFPFLLYQTVYLHEMGMLGIWISRAATEFFIGISYDYFICRADIEEIIWKNR